MASSRRSTSAASRACKPSASASSSASRMASAWDSANTASLASCGSRWGVDFEGGRRLAVVVVVVGEAVQTVAMRVKRSQRSQDGGLGLEERAPAPPLPAPPPSAAAPAAAAPASAGCCAALDPSDAAPLPESAPSGDIVGRVLQSGQTPRQLGASQRIIPATLRRPGTSAPAAG